MHIFKTTIVDAFQGTGTPNAAPPAEPAPLPPAEAPKDASAPVEVQQQLVLEKPAAKPAK